MKVAVLNYCGTVGKTTIAAHVLAPRMEEAKLYAIETINETAAELGLSIEKLKGEKFGQLYRDLMIEDSAVIDVGASNIEEFIDRLVKHAGSHEEFDYFVIPVTNGGKEQKETIKTIQALSRVGVPKDKIRVLFNRVSDTVESEFAGLIEWVTETRTGIANPSAAIYENEVFNLLSEKRTTISAVLADERDYKAMMRQTDDPDELARYADMHAIKALAKGVKRQLDAAYQELFAA